MGTVQLTFELTKKQQQEMVVQYIDEATEEELHCLFKTILTQRRNDVDSTELLKKFAKMVATNCLTPRNYLSDLIKPL